jgi:hypothetical protein
VGTHLYTTSDFEGIISQWLRLAWRAGLYLGITAPPLVTAYATKNLGDVAAVAIAGAVLGLVIGLWAGIMTASCLSALARPLALRPSSRLARLRAAIVAALATEIAVFPVQCLARSSQPPSYIILVPTVLSLLTAAIAATRLAPAGAVAAYPEPLVRIATSTVPLAEQNLDDVVGARPAGFLAGDELAPYE